MTKIPIFIALILAPSMNENSHFHFININAMCNFWRTKIFDTKSSQLSIKVF